MIEAVAAALGLISVGLTNRRSLWCWPVGLVMVTLYAFVFWQARLYSDMALQVIYIPLQLYGWWVWTRWPPGADERPIGVLRGRDRCLWLAGIVLGSVLLGGGMARWTDAALPLPDALTTVASLAAQWLLGRKMLESWALWIAIDSLSIVIYTLRALYVTAALYAVFLVMATIGLVAWYRALPRLHAAAA